MSVICGFLSFDNNKSPLIYGNRMVSSLENIAVDKVECWHDDNLFLSCHHQFITPESINETLPYYDSDAGIAIVANAIIDNREELFQIFNIPSSEWGKYTDSQLILLAYKKWGEECSKHLLGDFTYAIYEEKIDKLICTRDHAGRSTFYYTRNNSYFAFCTIMKPLICINDDKELDEQWIADFLSIPTVMSELDTSLTVYSAIKQLQPANTLVLQDKRVRISKYWDPMKAPKIKYKNDEEYDEEFREIITEATRCKLRSAGNIGILLSGGFDSCTIGCIAAGLLQPEGKKIKSYTSIPMDGYIERFGKNAITDESPYVEEITKMYTNIEATFCRSEGKNSFYDIQKYLDIIEQPYKIVENLFWHDDIYERASKDNCKVLLSGQYGNITISHGDFFTQFHTLLSSGRLLKLINEIQMYSRNYKVGRKKIVKTIITEFMPLLNKLMDQNTARERYMRSFPLVNPIFAEQNNEEVRLNNARYGNKNYRGFTLNGYRRYAFNYPLFSQIAGFEKKLDIHNNLITRDPTKDKRLIEFCFSIPGDQYIRNGRDKVILRRSMKGIIPDKIRLNYTKKGVQAADWIQRIIPMWDDITNQVKECISDGRIEKYINTKDVYNFLSENKELNLNTNSVDIRQSIVAYIFSKFIFQTEG